MAKPTADTQEALQKSLDRRAKQLRILSRGPHWRPQQRGDCEDVPRPCPYMGCRYNLSIDLNFYKSVHWRQKEEWDGILEGKDNCALDVAARGPHTLQEIADLSGVCRERIRQELDVALDKLKPFLTHKSAISGVHHVHGYSESPEDALMKMVGLDPKKRDDRLKFRTDETGASCAEKEF